MFFYEWMAGISRHPLGFQEKTPAQKVKRPLNPRTHATRDSYIIRTLRACRAVLPLFAYALVIWCMRVIRTNCASAEGAREKILALFIRKDLSFHHCDCPVNTASANGLTSLDRTSERKTAPHTAIDLPHSAPRHHPECVFGPWDISGC